MAAAVCEVEICDLPVYRQGLCKPHMARVERTGDLSADVPINRVANRPKVCTASGCEARPYGGGGLCPEHYTVKFRRGWRANGKALPCEVDGCEKPVRSRGYCASHYNKLLRWGTPTPPEKPPPARKKRDSRNGYVLVKAPDNPMAMKNGFVPEHRLVMSEILGRPLEKFENVHHINGVRDDNRPENLELWNTYQPAGQRVADKVDWAAQILRLYAPELLR